MTTGEGDLARELGWWVAAAFQPVAVWSVIFFE
jgi:hypothetical protein